MVATIFVRRIRSIVLTSYRPAPTIGPCSVPRDRCPASARARASRTSAAASRRHVVAAVHDDGRRLEVRSEGGEVLEFVLSPATARFVAAGSAHGPRLELLD